MATHDLLKSQRNDVLLQIQTAGFNANEFEWGRMSSKQTRDLTVPRLYHTPSRFWYRFELNKGLHSCEFSPGDQTLTKAAYPGSWEAQLSYVQNWLSYLRREVDAPDLWATLSQESALFESSGDRQSNDNSQFSPSEQLRIKHSIDELRQYFVTTHGEDQQRIAFVNERLNYLIAASERMGRKDWKILALGVITNIVVGAALAPEAARDLLRVTGAVLGWLLGTAALLGP